MCPSGYIQSWMEERGREGGLRQCECMASRSRWQCHVRSACGFTCTSTNAHRCDQEAGEQMKILVRRQEGRRQVVHAREVTTISAATQLPRFMCWHMHASTSVDPSTRASASTSSALTCACTGVKASRSVSRKIVGRSYPCCEDGDPYSQRSVLCC